MPKVLNKHKDIIPKDAVYIGRPGPFGNPYPIDRNRDRSYVIRNYEEWINTQPDLIEKIKRELRGKDLVCFCSPLPCHGDVILRIANS